MMPLCTSLENANSSIVTKSRAGVTWDEKMGRGQRERFTKAHKETFGDDESVHDFDNDELSCLMCSL